VELRQIRYALAVAKARSFSRAASRLSISQSAVSEQVKLLEDEVGFALFVRTARGVDVTDRGRIYLNQAERVVGRLSLRALVTPCSRRGLVGADDATVDEEQVPIDVVAVHASGLKAAEDFVPQTLTGPAAKTVVHGLPGSKRTRDIAPAAAVGQGAKAAVESQIASLGTNLLVVVPGATTSSGVRAGTGSASTLTVDDAEAIRKEIPGVQYLAPGAQLQAQVVAGNQNWYTRIQGTSSRVFHHCCSIQSP
jgi:DNA-binding Lrp family transcriptional regulator